MRRLIGSRKPASSSAIFRRGNICRSLACCAVFLTRITTSPFSRRMLRMSVRSSPTLTDLAAVRKMRAMRRTSKSSCPSVSDMLRSRLICAKERALARVMRTLSDISKDGKQTNKHGKCLRSLQTTLKKLFVGKKMAQMSKISEPKDDGALAYNYRHCASMTSQAVLCPFFVLSKRLLPAVHI